MADYGIYPVRDEADVLIAVHVAPSNPDGSMREPHIASGMCLCVPELEHLDGAPLILIHRSDA